ncbi:hypothetical protein PLESTB_001042600 [Pleodorina starrii]|uniref:Uncharacterized protein n=1 Tax=Pleodorina starrii TaxID=330485 RepID=A0A9W6F4W1_9CHLO|nr:hypothetical protein PLESTB_001042600 [Pleodorina starrii]
MKPAKELSAQLSARLAPADGSIDGKRGGSDYSKLRGIIRSQKDQIQTLENEVAHFQSRLHRIEDGHRLELNRLKKEVEYHKRLRQASDQRSYELEDKLGRLQQQHQQQQVAARQLPSHDDEKDSLILQSQLLISKNSELGTKVKMLESQLTQLEELKAALESALNASYCERDELAAELELALARLHHQSRQRPLEAEPSLEADGETECEWLVEGEASEGKAGLDDGPGHGGGGDANGDGGKGGGGSSSGGGGGGGGGEGQGSGLAAGDGGEQASVS